MFRMNCVLASLFAAALGGTAHAQKYSDVVAFGDSLSDNGNYYKLFGSPTPPYWNGRFSNGRVWIEQLSNWLGLDPANIADLAVGGATTADVYLTQVSSYVVAHGGVVSPDALYTVWAGGNDLLGLMSDPNGDPVQVIGDAMSNLGNSIGLLLASGAKHILVVNLPNLSLIPLVTAAGDPQLTAQVQALSEAFNDAFGQLVGYVEATFGVDLMELDAFETTNDLVQSPRKFNLKNVVDTAFDGVNVVKKPDGYLFWDARHPTRVGHNAVAGRAVAALGQVWCDLDDSGAVDCHDVKLLVRSYGPCAGGCRADLNADGVVDDADLKILQSVRH